MLKLPGLCLLKKNMCSQKKCRKDQANHFIAFKPVANVVQVAESLVATSSRGASRCCSAAEAGGRGVHHEIWEFTMWK